MIGFVCLLCMIWFNKIPSGSWVATGHANLLRRVGSRVSLSRNIGLTLINCIRLESARLVVNVWLSRGSCVRYCSLMRVARFFRHR